MNVDFFLDRVLLTEFFKVSYTCSGDCSVCDGQCTYTHLLHANVSAHNTCTFCLRTLRTSSCVSRIRMAQVSVKRCLHMCHTSPSRVLHSHVSPVSADPARSLRDHSRLRLHWRSHPHDIAVLSRRKSAGHAPLSTCMAKLGYLTKSVANTGCEYTEWDTTAWSGTTPLLWTRSEYRNHRMAGHFASLDDTHIVAKMFHCRASGALRLLERGTRFRALARPSMRDADESAAGVGWKAAAQSRPEWKALKQSS